MRAVLCFILAVFQHAQGQWVEKSFGETRDYYKVFREKATFDEAEKRCISVGGHLASIHSEQENKFITELSTDGRRRQKLEY
ncbi:hypothetical protein COOONC_05100 [Cooperia oncophora]